MTDKSPIYVLGHSYQELARLNRQAGLIDPSTRQFFQEAGITSGMRVLDVGSGAGHTAFVAAELVGGTGEVIGTDRALEAIKMAQRNAEAQHLHNVSFRHGDVTDMDFERPFDAVVGRCVLIFNRNAPSMLRRLAKQLKLGGLIVFHEPTMLVAQSFPRAPLYDLCCHWAIEGFRLGGTQIDTAHGMHNIFVAAGLPAPTMRMHVSIGGAPGIFEWLHRLAEIIQTLLPVIEQHGIATAAEVDIDTLAHRLCREVTLSGSTVLGRGEIAAWAHV
jgi:SAM-dependent methyltransferase